MRIIGGTLSGRTLIAPIGRSTRPTADRVREALFNRLQHADLPGLVDDGPFSGAVLDLYAGSGALGLEALSRGATWCDFVEQDRSAHAVLERNVETLSLSPRARVHKMPVELFLKKATGPYTLLFADPPYADGSELDRVLARVHDKKLLVEGALVVLEHAPSPAPSQHQPGLTFVDQRAYGQTLLSFFVAASGLTAARHGNDNDA